MDHRPGETPEGLEPRADAARQVATQDREDRDGRIDQIRQLIASGKVKVVLYGETGREIILSILRADDFFGEMSLLLGEAPVADIVALTPLQVLHLGG